MSEVPTTLNKSFANIAVKDVSCVNMTVRGLSVLPSFHWTKWHPLSGMAEMVAVGIVSGLLYVPPPLTEPYGVLSAT